MTANTLNHRKPLDKALRSALEKTVIKARDVAEAAAEAALARIGVGDAKAADYLTDEERNLRNRLRAHGRQLGDTKKANGEQNTRKLISEAAYEHWHRMLFARFLEQNHLLMYEPGVALTLHECDELVRDGVYRDAQEQQCRNGWELAGVLASKMLPQIFRTQSPVFALHFAPEDQRALEQLVNCLALETFQAQDSLGWVYQFWQSKRKEEVNKSEVKIGADELSPVTQLFTEPYMVSFLLDNSLGAWWANKRLSKADRQSAQSEQELRDKAAIPGVPLSYLRFVKDEATDQWQPASGTFDAWPKNLSELKTLDPCCGSGHFLVAAFLMLVPIRMVLEDLTEQQTIDKVLRENLHGLELDQRCVELAAFAVALEAWRYPNAGGYRILPELHLACSGLSIHAAKDEWKAISATAGKQNLSIALDWLYQTFKDAPVLGSLINPRRSHAAKIAQWPELQQALSGALKIDEQQQNEQHQKEHAGQDISERIEAAIVAQGLTKAAELLSGQYHWVMTNVPYLAQGKQNDTLKNFCEEYYTASKNDLATVFLDRCLEFCAEGGSTSVVLPQNWLFLGSYRKFREKLLTNDTWHLIARLGAKAFQTPMWDFNVQLITLSRGNSGTQTADLLGSAGARQWIAGVDVSEPRTAAEKAALLVTDEVKTVEQAKQLENPDARVALCEQINFALLGEYAQSGTGIQTFDSPRFLSNFWERSENQGEIFKICQTTVEKTEAYGGLSQSVRWEQGKGELYKLMMEKERLENYKSGIWKAWSRFEGKKGICVSLMRHLPTSIYSGFSFDNNTGVVIPNIDKDLIALWCFSASKTFNELVREIDQKLNVTNATLVKIPFDRNHWTKVAEEQYPNGLPEPFSHDPTQWIFHGHPSGSVVWDEHSKWTVNGELRVDDTVLQIAVIRLLGYQWPAEQDTDMELAEEQRAWVERCKDLAGFVDDDGIVCLSAVRGEKPAHERIEALLQASYGKQWTAYTKNRLLEYVDATSLANWLRDKFFEQHCKLFQNRPFIWHIWDGLKDGFHVLVNYHKLDKAGLERLIYTYLGDWIRTQQSELANGTDGAQERLTAAEILKRELEAILEGEAPYDVFVRWKPLPEQPIGWNPDLNDGVRLNIRPFVAACDVGKKGAGLLRAQPNIKWDKDRGKDVESAPWYHLGLAYGGKEGDRINDHHLTLAEKRKAREL
jgi:hypothetical protein